MDIEKILRCVDHTELKVTATMSDIINLCDDAVRYNTASVCIAPCFVKGAKDYLKDKKSICTVIGFPNGYNNTKTKIFETAQALSDGADEIDMVANIGDIKSGGYNFVLKEIKEIKKICDKKILKVIIETCLLTDEEKINMCKIVSESGADFIKTSTGFSTGGATIEDIILIKNNIFGGVKIKAAGGIKNLEDAELFLNSGASRLGTSRIVKLVKENEKNG